MINQSDIERKVDIERKIAVESYRSKPSYQYSASGFSKDLAVLDPHRFESSYVGSFRKPLIFRSNMGIGQLRSCIVEEEIEIVASYVPAVSQVKVLALGLNEHNKPYEEELERRLSPVAAIIKNRDGQPIAGFLGARYKKTMLLSDIFVPDNNPELALALFQRWVVQVAPGVQEIYLDLPKSCWMIKHLARIGFRVEEMGSATEVLLSVKTGVLKKKLADLSFNVAFEMSDKQSYRRYFREQNPAQEVSDEDEIADALKTLAQGFYFLVQNQERQTLGGVSCRIESKEHCHVDMLWLHPTMRGLKLSEKLVASAEQHAKTIGCVSSGLSTGSYQAPWLYPKLGYKQVSSVPVGPYQGFHYRKKLSKL